MKKRHCGTLGCCSRVSSPRRCCSDKFVWAGGPRRSEIVEKQGQGVPSSTCVFFFVWHSCFWYGFGFYCVFVCQHGACFCMGLFFALFVFVFFVFVLRFFLFAIGPNNDQIWDLVACYQKIIGTTPSYVAVSLSFSTTRTAIPGTTLSSVLGSRCLQSS